MNDKLEYTPHEYKIEVMKKRIAELVTNYEETIANQATQTAQLESELRRARAELEQNAEDKEDGSVEE